MNARELEAKYADRCIRRSSLLLFDAHDALLLLRDCFESGLPFLGVEGFRLFEGGTVQPAMEFSSICFGKLETVGDRPELVSFERQLRSDWATREDLYHDTVALIRKGAGSDCRWYEVTIRDPDTDELLFFRSPPAEARSAP